MKKIEGFTETILTENPKEAKINTGTIKADTNRITQSRFDVIDKLIENKIKNSR